MDERANYREAAIKESHEDFPFLYPKKEYLLMKNHQGVTMTTRLTNYNTNTNKNNNLQQKLCNFKNKMEQIALYLPYNTAHNSSTHYQKQKLCNPKNKMEQNTLYLPYNTAHNSSTHYHSPEWLRKSRAFPYPRDERLCWRMTQSVKCPCEGKETFLCRHARIGLRSRSIVGAIPCGRPLTDFYETLHSPEICTLSNKMLS
jgi:hypothetical protein